jgi:hypothetical protein
MAGMGVGPRLHVAQAVDEGDADGFEVDVLQVQDLEAGRVERGIVRIWVLPDLLQPRPVGVQAPRGIGEDVELDLTDPLLVELLGQRDVGVLDLFEDGEEGQEGREELGPGLDVVAVVRPEHLHVVQGDAVVREAHGQSRPPASPARRTALGDGTAGAGEGTALVRREPSRDALAATRVSG